MTSNHIALSMLAAAGLLACGVAREVSGAAGGGACVGCHGDASRSGTPLEQAAPATGAHLAHLEGGVACGSCHVVPEGTAHADDAVQVVFTGVSVADGARPTYSAGTCANVYCHGATLSAGGNGAVPVDWDGPPTACASCHGAPPPSHDPASTACAGCHPGSVMADGSIDRAGKLHVNAFLDGGAGGTHADGWSLPASHGPAAKQNLASCKACHGVDLGGGGAGISCGTCHAGGADWASNCTFCHGTKTSPYTPADLARAAPPRGTKGETATTSRAVGAHQTHLSGGSFGGPVACADCHAVPGDLSHLDATAQVTFGAAARRDSATPFWNGTTCANVYCHGGTLAGGAIAAPSWTGSGQVSCGSCHGLPPTGSHTTSTDCAGCHGYDGATFDAALHLNGTVDFGGGGGGGGNHPDAFAAPDQHGFEANRTGLSSCKGCHGADLTGGAGPSCGTCHPGGGTVWATSCTFCHGTGTQPAPPVDTQGGSATANVSVGAHASHVGTTLMTPPACTECHEGRSSVVTDAAHVDGDGVAEVSFGTLARTGSAPATYTRTSDTVATCASTYCHGRFTGGANSGQGATMSWTSTAPVGCASCHGSPPSTGKHTKHVGGAGFDCGECHPGFSASSVSQAAHLNGTKQVGANSGWDAIARSCSMECHGKTHNGLRW
jgi:predicted CxxxxCH...CXXCH cytochrome family protein